MNFDNELTIQDNYYIKLPNYYILKELCKYINDEKYTSRDLIAYVRLNKICINSYVKISDSTYAPLIYPASIAKKNIKFFRWLIKNKAKTNLQLDYISRLHENIGTLMPPDIEFVCNLENISLLKQNLNINIRNIEYCMMRGDIKRINALELSDVCCKHIKNNPSFAFNILESLIQKITVLCTTPGLNKSTEIDKVIDKYALLFRIISNFVQPSLLHLESNISLINLCINWYLFKIIKELHWRGTSKSIGIGSNGINQPVFYEDMNKEVVAIYRQIYNEYYYYNTCITLNLWVDPRVDV